MRPAVWLPLGLIMLLLLAPTAQAHARPVTITPQAGARLAQPPAEVRIDFNEPINPRATVIEVFDANGTRVSDGMPRVEGRRVARLALELNATDAGYLVRWSTYSTVDGHRMAGSWGFAVGNATPPQGYSEVRSPLPFSAVLARAVSYVGLVGTVAVTWLSRSAFTRYPRTVNLAAASVGLLFFGSAFLFLQGSNASGGILSDDYSRRVGWQVVAAVLIGLTIGMQPGPKATALRSVLLVAWVLVQGLSSHAMAAVGPAGALLDSIHLAFAIVWIGCAAALWLDPRSGDEFRQSARLTARAATLGLGGLVVTGAGLFLALTHFAGRPITALSTGYGLVLLYKLAAVGALAGFGAVNHFVHLRRLASQPERATALRANLRRELAVALIVFLLAAILATLDPQVS